MSTTLIIGATRQMTYEDERCASGWLCLVQRGTCLSTYNNIFSSLRSRTIRNSQSYLVPSLLLWKRVKSATFSAAAPSNFQCWILRRFPDPLSAGVAYSPSVSTPRRLRCLGFGLDAFSISTSAPLAPLFVRLLAPNTSDATKSQTQLTTNELYVQVRLAAFAARVAMQTVVTCNV